LEDVPVESLDRESREQKEPIDIDELEFVGNFKNSEKEKKVRNKYEQEEEKEVVKEKKLKKVERKEFEFSEF